MARTQDQRVTRGRRARCDGGVSIDLVAATPLLDRMWELNPNITGYDAAYRAVAETFDCALVAADARLTQVSDLQCEVRLARPTS